MDPFWLSPDPVCVPDLLDTPSLKYKTIQRGTLSTGPGGVGFLLCSPVLSLTNDRVSIINSDSVYAGTGFPATDGTAGVQGVFNVNAPFSASIFGVPITGVTGRPVAVGVRIRYLGTLLNTSGQAYLCRIPADQTTANMNEATIGSYQQFQLVPITKNKWIQVNWIPGSGADYEYIGTIPLTGVSTTRGSFGIFISGVAGAFNFQYEVSGYYEVIGPKFGTSLSSSDIEGLSVARELMNKVSYNTEQVASTGTDSWQQTIAGLSSLSPNEISSWVRAGAKFASAAYSAYGMI